jgi:hypothetical protein
MPFAGIAVTISCVVGNGNATPTGANLDDFPAGNDAVGDADLLPV